MRERLRPYRFSTQPERQEHQFDAWRSAMETTIDVSRPRGDDPRAGFSARFDAWDMDGLGLVSMEMPGEGFTRQWNHIRPAPVDHWSLLIPVRDSRGLAYPKRPMAFGSLARPFEGSGADTHVISLFIARDLFRGTPHMLDGLVGGLGDSGLTRLLADFVIALRERLDHGDDLDAAALQKALSTMVLACLLPARDDRMRLAAGAIQATLVERIKAYVRRRLGDPGLGWSDICRQFGLSRSSLHRILEDDGGVTSFIRRERLAATHQALAEAGESANIRAIADRFGFGEPSGFSRAFRREFGYAPSEVRDAVAFEATPLQGQPAADGGLDALFLGLRRSPSQL